MKFVFPPNNPRPCPRSKECVGTKDCLHKIAPPIYMNLSFHLIILNFNELFCSFVVLREAVHFTPLPISYPPSSLVSHEINVLYQKLLLISSVVELINNSRESGDKDQHHMGPLCFRLCNLHSTLSYSKEKGDLPRQQI